MRTPVAVLGAAGRMGLATCAAIEAASDLELVARIEVADDLAAVLAASQARVAVDFTTPESAEANVAALVAAGVHAVVGTTGWHEAALSRTRELLARHADIGVVIAPNFAISAVLAMQFAKAAAPYFESAEIVEGHHPAKLDAPSGTAVRTAELIGAARASAGLSAMPDATVTGHEARGLSVAGVPVHALRLRGLTAGQEVLFGNPGEALVIRADSFDRISFMPGVLLAVRAVTKRPGLTVGLEHLLGGQCGAAC